jgi:hypothetical protein
MGWTVYYDASTPNGDIDLFVASANQVNLPLSKNCEPYEWTAKDAQSASGFSKVHYSKTPELDFIAILMELQLLSRSWTHVKITVSDDYYLDRRDIRQVKIDDVLD